MKMIKKILNITLIATSLFVLASCGSDGIGGTGKGLEDLNSTPEGSLFKSNEKSLATYFQKAMKLRNEKIPEVSVSADGGNASGGEQQFSSTNIQEVGVEEADLIKTDGRYIYSIKKTPRYYGGFVDVTSPVKQEGTGKTSDVIRIMEVAESGLKEVKSFSGESWNVSGLYLYGDNSRLVALSSSNQNYYGNWFDGTYFANQKTDIMLIDVKDVEAASIKTTLSFDGSLISSRRNDDTLYVILRHYPDYQYEDDKKLLETSTEDFLPSYRVNNAKEVFISKAEDCFQEKGRVGKADIITLVAIDLKSETPKINSQCYVGSAEAFYASQKALYLATTRWEYQVNNGVSDYGSDVTTDIHKFSYDGLNFNYRGSGEVDGHLGNKQDSKSFRFSESKDMLRVVTFDEDQWAVFTPEIAINDVDTAVTASKDPVTKSPVSLSILKEDSSKKALQLISKLPNADRPEPIGLPGEQLYATRFIGDRAYVVTFRVVDPLYVLDLSNPSDPFIAGELKVDGYSDYLHPISETLLLGVGKDAIPAENALDDRGAWYQGVKLSLIDVSSPANPREVDKVILGKRGTDSAVLDNHHAFTSMRVDDKYRVALPVRLHEEDDPFVDGGDLASFFHQFKQLGLYRFEIDLNSQQFMEIPPMIVQSENVSDSFSQIYNDRSVLINDDVHYMHNGDFWSQDWKGDSALVGPK